MILSLKGIYKNYLTGSVEVPALKNINLEVEKGDYLAIMGPSGSGKSTLMNIIGCLDKPTSGEYLFDGINIEIGHPFKLKVLVDDQERYFFVGFNDEVVDLLRILKNEYKKD